MTGVWSWWYGAGGSFVSLPPVARTLVLNASNEPLSVVAARRGVMLDYVT